MSYECLDTRKWCHAALCEKTHPLKALGSMARFLGNSVFILINDRYPLAQNFTGMKLKS